MRVRIPGWLPGWIIQPLSRISSPLSYQCLNTFKVPVYSPLKIHKPSRSSCSNCCLSLPLPSPTIFDCRNFFWLWRARTLVLGKCLARGKFGWTDTTGSGLFGGVSGFVGLDLTCHTDPLSVLPIFQSSRLHRMGQTGSGYRRDRRKGNQVL